MRVLAGLRRHLSYANVVASFALFVALGGTSYAVLHIRSRDVVDNSLRSRDVRNRTLLARDLRRDSIGGGVIKEAGLGRVPAAFDAQRLGGLTPQDLRVRCPANAVARTGVCIEVNARTPVDFFSAMSICDEAGRGLATMPQLARFAQASGPLPQPEWTGSVYRNVANGSLATEQLETVVLNGFGNPDYERVFLAVQHAFRCVALPAN